jgi:hypothetical protein
MMVTDDSYTFQCFVGKQRDLDARQRQLLSDAEEQAQAKKAEAEAREDAAKRARQQE